MIRRFELFEGEKIAGIHEFTYKTDVLIVVHVRCKNKYFNGTDKVFIVFLCY